MTTKEIRKSIIEKKGKQPEDCFFDDFLPSNPLPFLKRMEEVIKEKGIFHWRAKALLFIIYSIYYEDFKTDEWIKIKEEADKELVGI